MELEWVSIKDKLPKLQVSFSYGFTWESDRVLVCGRDYEICVCALYADEGKQNIWWWDKRHGAKQEGITHWMPKPEKPSFDE